jgi:hypothetical protein
VPPHSTAATPGSTGVGHEVQRHRAESARSPPVYVYVGRKCPVDAEESDHLFRRKVTGHFGGK